MDPTRFDALARSLTRPASRRGALALLAGGAVTTLAGGTATAKRRHHRGHAQAADAGGNKGGNSDCAHFCATVFPAGPQRGQCVSDAAHNKGLCPLCQANPDNLCGTTCCTGTDTCQGGTCAPACVAPPLGTASCHNDGDCDAGQVCRHGGCFVDCTASGSCSQACADCQCEKSTDDSTLVCTDDGFGIGGCHSDADCPLGAICDRFIVNGDYSAHLCTRPCPR